MLFLKNTEFHPCLQWHPGFALQLEERTNEEVAESQGKGLYRHFSKAHADKLFVNGKYIASGEPIKWYPFQ